MWKGAVGPYKGNELEYNKLNPIFIDTIFEEVIIKYQLKRTAMTKKILENNGTLDKYIGDAQMAFWNAPIDETLHCKEAVKAALEMLTDLEKFNEEITKEGIPAFGMGLGINTGVIVIGAAPTNVGRNVKVLNNQGARQCGLVIL